MRVLKLEMQAFGPFKEKIVIDFEKFGSEGLYLISGDTGSGKTTIFDAITYALYGESSGGDRSESMIRYIAATPEIRTYIILEFEHRKNRYIIERHPKQLRNKDKGEGVTDRDTKKAILKFPDGKEIYDPNEVDNNIVKILGIDENQFRQITMLAQGKFMKLLKASSSEKVELFRNIFFTENFEKLEKEVFLRFRELKSNLDSKSAEKNLIISNFKIPEDKEEFEEIVKYSTRDIIDYIENLNNELVKNKDKLLKEKEELSIQKDNSNILIDKIKEYFNKKELIKNIEEELKNLNESFEKINFNYSIIPEKEEIKEKINQNIKNIELELEKIGKIEELKSSKKDYELDYFSIKDNILKIEKELEEKTNELEKNKIFIELNKDNKLKIQQYEVKIEKLSDILKATNNIFDLIEKREKLKNSKEILDEKYLNEKLIVEDKYKKYIDIKNLYFESQSGILAKNLIEGEECPVCGSKKHPKKAKYHEYMPEKEEVDKQEKIYFACLNNFEEIKNEITLLVSELNHTEKNIEENLNNNSLKEENLVQFRKNIYADKIELENKINEELEIKDKIEEKAKNIENTKIKKVELEKLNLGFNERKISIKENIKILDKRILEESKKVNSSKEELVENLNRYTKESQDISNFINRIREEYSEYNNKIVGLESKLSTLKEQIDEKYNLNIDEENKKLENLIEKINVKTLVIGRLETMISINKEQNIRLKKLNLEIIDVENKFIILEKINRLLSGQISGGAKIKFETFVQMRYFDQIIYYANKRFHGMTDGNYSLQRKKSVENKVAQQGLDICVIDHHNKSERNINTLSGGESFQAALSLALGLSDVIQKKSGGVELNSMFVDEGFGTLDKETLEKVMLVLSKISKTNKLIGIISHVEDLKEKIDKKILVEKKKEGHSILKKIEY